MTIPSIIIIDTNFKNFYLLQCYAYCYVAMIQLMKTVSWNYICLRPLILVSLDFLQTVFVYYVTIVDKNLNLFPKFKTLKTKCLKMTYYFV